MNHQQVRERFCELVAPDMPNEWDLDEVADVLAGKDGAELILTQVPVIWPVSSSLCYNYISQAPAALACFEAGHLPAWVGEILDRYEAGGLHGAQRFMLAVEEGFASRLEGKAGARLESVIGWLRPYLHGLAGRPLELETAEIVSTDTATIFLPPELNRLKREEDNALLYKLIVSYQWAFIRIGSLAPFADSEPPTERFVNTFSRPDLALRLYHGLECLRAGIFLWRELPGLMRSTRTLRASLAERSQDHSGFPDGILSRLDRENMLLSFECPESIPSMYRVLCRGAVDNGATTVDSLRLTGELYGEVLKETGGEVPEPPVFQGVLQPKAVAAARRRMREELAGEWVDQLAALLVQVVDVEGTGDSEQQSGNGVGRENSGRTVILEKRPDPVSATGQTYYLRIDNEGHELPPEMQQLCTRLEQDLRVDPAAYISAAVGRAGRLCAIGPGTEAPEGEVTPLAPSMYDEWDFRRSGYRKNWCAVNEREMPVIRSSFVAATLDKYRGQLVRLRQQFELLRTTERFLRRQRDGDDIDLDALTDSIADSRAGLPPSDRLFIRLQRDERDIAVLFLVDMSNSTEGWVGTAIKESLVLICEAMERVGDRYGVYGFSGMRRLRSEIFHVKHIEEPYDEAVRSRIGAMGPREYTRMAPAVRHMIRLLGRVDARVRLLITLSDGKPEDYDDYKGEYAIEDTRKAFLEARAEGIHPFCLTIDQHAHEYLAHMCGEKNSVFIDDVRRLPARIPELYRILTS